MPTVIVNYTSADLGVVEGKVDMPVDFAIPVHFSINPQHGHVFAGYRINSLSLAFLIKVNY
jgi:hypothetical protein